MVKQNRGIIDLIHLIFELFTRINIEYEDTIRSGCAILDMRLPSSSHLLIFKGPCASMWPCLCGFFLCSMIIHEMFVTIKVAKEFNTNG